ncbi:hypothetical protein IQ62_41155 [Streptomyces scabiei]|uniref:SCO2400 family protein n=1 Tax=Streptomyces scabiei TaxID=1930 RepID=UPI0004E791D8|nr:hypothetical protein IQ62_41155 [Streptomyces scabiei]
MDYCHPCQRHLNGALSCSGCGASAEECRTHPDALSAGDDTTADPHESPFEPAEAAPVSPGGRRARGRGRGARAARQAPDVDGRAGASEQVAGGDGPEADGPPGRSRGRGRGRDARAGRRDRKAAAHRRRRRRVLMVGAGLLLAAGGLSLAELGMEAPPKEPRAASVDDVSDASPSASVDGAEEAGGGPVGPADTEKGRKKPDKSPSPSASESGKSKDEDADEDDDKPADRSASNATVSPAPPAGNPTPDPEDADDPTADPTADETAPQPSPSATCKQFLWWCS